MILLNYYINVNNNINSSSKDNLLQLLLQILDDLIFVPAHLLQPKQLIVSRVYLLDQAQNFLGLDILGLHLLLDLLFVLRAFLLLFLILGGPGSGLLGVLRQAALLLRFLKLGEDVKEQFLDDARSGVGDVLDVRLAELYAQLLEGLAVERVPVLDLFGQRVGGRVVVQVDQFGTVVLQQLGHHQAVRKVPVDVLFRPRKRDTVHHLVNFLKLLFLHSNYYNPTTPTQSYPIHSWFNEGLIIIFE
jgi:hypothetical protein